MSTHCGSRPSAHHLDVSCPDCRGLARFDAATIRAISLKQDVAFFQQHPTLEYGLFTSQSGQNWHGARYFPGLHGDPRRSLHSLPQGYQGEDWGNTYLPDAHMTECLGSVTCEQCGFRARHLLQWPVEAYFSLTYKGQLLWAYNREAANDLLDYLLSDRRRPDHYRWARFLRHVPTLFKTRKARPAVARQLSRLLS